MTPTGWTLFVFLSVMPVGVFPYQKKEEYMPNYGIKVEPEDSITRIGVLLNHEFIRVGGKMRITKSTLMGSHFVVPSGGELTLDKCDVSRTVIKVHHKGKLVIKFCTGFAVSIRNLDGKDIPWDYGPVTIQSSDIVHNGAQTVSMPPRGVKPKSFEAYRDQAPRKKRKKPYSKKQETALREKFDAAFEAATQAQKGV